MAHLLIVTATAAERDAAARWCRPPVVDIAGLDAAGLDTAGSDTAGSDTAGLDTAGLDVVRAGGTGAGTVDFLVGGVGVAAAAAATATALATAHVPYSLVVSAGIAGGFAPLAVGDAVVADAVVLADLGAEDGARFLPSSALGLGPERFALDAALTAELARRAGAHVGAVLSVSTVTGTQATADARRRRSPDAAAEAMEGAGVLAAARIHGVVFAEVRTISNLVGPRDRDAWRIGPALDALATAVAAMTRTPLHLPVRAPVHTPVEVA